MSFIHGRRSREGINSVISGHDSKLLCSCRAGFWFGNSRNFSGSCTSQLREFHMAGGGSKGTDGSGDENVPGAPAEAVRPEVREILQKQMGREPTPTELRAFLTDKMESETKKQKTELDRLRRDQQADTQGHKWHKGVNAQLDLYADVGAAIKRCEHLLRASQLALPSGAAVTKLVEGDGITMDELEVIDITEIDAVKTALAELDKAQEILAVRSRELGVVKNAPTAKAGYRTLDIMATAGTEPSASGGQGAQRSGEDDRRGREGI